jgi:hypothetical protein
MAVVGKQVSGVNLQMTDDRKQMSERGFFFSGYNLSSVFCPLTSDFRHLKPKLA